MLFGCIDVPPNFLKPMKGKDLFSFHLFVQKRQSEEKKRTGERASLDKSVRKALGVLVVDQGSLGSAASW